MTLSVKTARLIQEAGPGLTFVLLVSWSSLPLLVVAGAISTRTTNNIFNKSSVFSIDVEMELLPQNMNALKLLNAFRVS